MTNIPILWASENPESASSGNQGEWRLMVTKCRSLKDKLFGNNKMIEGDQIIAILSRVICDEPDMKLLAIERD